LTGNESVSMAAFSCHAKWAERKRPLAGIIFRNFDLVVMAVATHAT
jgi:hypothetical protein